MFRLLIHCFILSATCFEVYSGLRILAFFPLPWRSHQFVYRQLIRGLGDKGHSVDLYTPLPMKNPPQKVNQILLEDSLNKMVETYAGSSFFEDYANSGPWNNVVVNYEIAMYMVEKTKNASTAYEDLLKSNKIYDVVISEYAMFHEPIAYLSHKFNASLVLVAGMLDHPWVNELSGLPNNPSYMLGFESVTDNNLDFMGRLYNFYSTVTIVTGCYFYTLTSGQEFADKHIVYEGWNARPKLIDVVFDASLILLNSHPSMAYPVPRAPHVKEIGGIHITQPEPLPKGIQEFMDSADNGVIYFSLGSNLDPNNVLGYNYLNVFVNVFKKLKQKVLWKINGTLGAQYSNIKTQNWFPQQDVLGHKNVVLFITHGGLQSMVETINFGVPIIVMPFVFDQKKDAAYMTSIGIGIQLNAENLSEETLSAAINEVLANPKFVGNIFLLYKEQSKKRQTMFKDRPLTPVDESVYWVEYVAKHGNVLQPASVRMPFYQMYLLDVYAVLIVASVMLLCIIKYILKSIASICMSKSKRIVEKEKVN